MTDPRPLVEESLQPVVAGFRCVSCSYPLAVRRPQCPVCSGELQAARFGPGGTVFAATVIRIPVGELRPPYGLAYVDLDDGPRILARLAEDGDAVTPAPVGARVRLRGRTPAGDPLVEVER